MFMLLRRGGQEKPKFPLTDLDRTAYSDLDDLNAIKGHDGWNRLALASATWALNHIKQSLPRALRKKGVPCPHDTAVTDGWRSVLYPAPPLTIVNANTRTPNAHFVSVRVTFGHLV